MDFGKALEQVKNGQKIGRQGWNGKGMYVDYVSGCQKFNSFQGNEPVNPVTYLPYLQMKTVDGAFVPWLASQTDILAEDWEIVNA